MHQTTHSYFLFYLSISLTKEKWEGFKSWGICLHTFWAKNVISTKVKILWPNIKDAMTRSVEDYNWLTLNQISLTVLGAPHVAHEYVHCNADNYTTIIHWRCFDYYKVKIPIIKLTKIDYSTYDFINGY